MTESPNEDILCPLHIIKEKFLNGAAAPRPIHDDVSYRNTVEIADVFAGFEDRMTADQNDYFDLLCQLIEKYDVETVKPPTPGTPALLK